MDFSTGPKKKKYLLVVVFTFDENRLSKYGLSYIRRTYHSVYGGRVMVSNGCFSEQLALNTAQTIAQVELLW